MTSFAECHVWSLPLMPKPSSWTGFLDDTELSRCSAFDQEADLARFVTGRVLAKTTLAFLAGTRPGAIRLGVECQDCGGPHGKPRVLGAAKGWELSIAYAGELAVVALARGTALGIDVERAGAWRGPGLPPQYDLVLTPVERATLELIPPRRRVRATLAHWTRKQAVLKATGEGHGTPMTDFSLSGPDRPAALLGWHPPDRRRPVPAIADIEVGRGYHGAVAALGVRRVVPLVHDGAELRTLLPGLATGTPSPGRLRTRRIRELSARLARPPRPARAKSPAAALI
ncbi:4'-phosphopantetheinyl transferase superfamily protein [Streptomyces sp. A7024]|uniref:4'-phosphopantetheinyl transferase superfamily protein n=1 Tax=Streptomyces coryli TaxID=1128680 RepID=A0A6G4TUF3_9ACTN|nr:4'-phosphopantetheinyl transferase superfamily protein [Streptomyces coryli]NGN63402.1 4'-phosphopantetheinyl transferase superfamily protein [Streptomyces coryli]